MSTASQDRGRIAAWVLALAVTGSVLAPLGAWAWGALSDHRAVTDAVERHLAAGDEAFAAGEYDRAAVAYARARASRDSLAVQVRLGRARAFLVAIHPDRIDGRDRAELDYERTWLSAADPANRATYVALGGHLQALEGSDEAASAAYQEALSLDDRNVAARYGLGVLAARKGDVTTATAEYAKVLAVLPTHIEARLGLADARLSGRDQAGAIEAYKEVLKTRNDAHAWQGLGFAYKAGGQATDAIAAFRKAIALDPKAYEAYLALGEVYVSGNPRLAEHMFRKALDLRQDEASLGALASVLNQQKRPAEALDLLAPLLRAHKAGPATLLQAGLAAEMLGRNDDAKALLTEVQRVVKEAGTQIEHPDAEGYLGASQSALNRIKAVEAAAAPTEDKPAE